jgi:hypothetical protein
MNMTLKFLADRIIIGPNPSAKMGLKANRKLSFSKLFYLLTLVFLPWQTWAEPLPKPDPMVESNKTLAYQYEFSPSAGLMGSSALIGLRVSMNTHPVTLELATDQVMGRTATLFPITVNAVLNLADLKKTVPYALIGGGLFLTVPINSVGDQTISSIGINFGGGLRYYISSRIGLRLETKQLFTRIENRRDHRQELLIFQSTSLGVIIAFG